MQMLNLKGQSFSSSITLITLLLFFTMSLSSISTMGHLRSSTIQQIKGYIVFVATPPGQDIKDFAIKTLTIVLGRLFSCFESRSGIPPPKTSRGNNCHRKQDTTNRATKTGFALKASDWRPNPNKGEGE
ncbi:hypothetical protein M9H77_18077 [Catharanthus roseus]|uniref:Uncharacterized protein n=1 Tax=Catharanthus roseus TaxID=4058 RepID=A0ACC0B6F5_CATRO|nr:hypothetical protein M9H77_18077 [Catharanthus roseus]